MPSITVPGFCDYYVNSHKNITINNNSMNFVTIMLIVTEIIPSITVP